MSPRPVTVITGGGRGIGAATAVHLARAGHDVVVGYRADAGAAAAVVEEVTAAGARGVGVRCDVREGDDVDALFTAGAGDPDRVARVAARVPMGRVGRPREIAWLLGPEAGYVTGAVLRVAGGP